MKRLAYRPDFGGLRAAALLTLEMQATGTVDFWAFYARCFRRFAAGLLLASLPVSGSVPVTWTERTRRMRWCVNAS